MIKDIFAKIRAHMLEGMVFHDEMMRYYDFLGLEEERDEHLEHYMEESDGYQALSRYFVNHYNMLIPQEKMKRPDVIPESWYRYTRQEVDASTRQTARHDAYRRWVEWERNTKDFYQEQYQELASMGEIAAAHFLLHFILAVDDELKCAEKKLLVK